MNKDNKNYVLNSDPSVGVTSRTEVPSTRGGQSLGQVKYARREGAVSIYKDVTRNTANDNMASLKAESSTICECEDEKTGEEY